MDANDPRTNELLLATLSETLRAQREIIEILLELRTEVAQLRETAGGTVGPDTPSSETAPSTAPEAIALEAEPPHDTQSNSALPVLKTLVNADGSTVEINEPEHPAGYLKVVD